MEIFLFMSFQSIHFIVHLSRTVKPLCSLHTMSCQQQRRKLVRSATMHIRLVSVVKYIATVWALSPSQNCSQIQQKVELEGGSLTTHVIVREGQTLFADGQA